MEIHMKTTGIPYVVTLWLRENNMSPESVSILENNVVCHFDESIIHINIQNNKIKKIRYSPKTCLV